MLGTILAILGIAIPIIGASFTVAYKWPQFYEQASRATMKVAVCISVLAAAYYVGAQHALIEAKRLISENQSLPENVADFRSQYHWFFIVFPMSVIVFGFLIEGVASMIRDEENQKNK